MLYDLLLRDIIEITMYSSCIFLFCIWLKTDKTKNLLGYFFVYSALALCAWNLQLPTLTSFLFSYAPIALLLFIVLHEKTLQRNAIALRSITPAQHIPYDSIDTIISSCLAMINAHKSITVIIERRDALDHFLDTPFMLNADVNKNILDLLLASASYDENKMIWVTHTGYIRGINASWISQDKTKDSTLFYTLQCDALVLNAHPIDRRFMLTYNGKEVKNISAHQVLTLIKKQLSTASSSQSQGVYRENNASEKHISR